MGGFAGQSESQGREAEIAGLAAAELELKALLTAGVAPAQALMRRGTQLMRENRMPEAVARFRSATILAPEDPAGWTNYGVALDRANLPTEAVAALEHSLSLSQSQSDTWLLLGLTRAKQGSEDAAEAAYRVVMEQEPRSALVWQCLGLLRESQKRYPEAIDCFLVAIERGGSTAALHANLGKLLHQTGRIAESGRAYARAVALDPANPRFREMLRNVNLLRDVLEGPSIDQGMAAYRASFGAETAPEEKEMAELFHMAFSFLSGFGHREAAARIGKRHLELWPDSQSMAYLMKAVRGDTAVDRSPASYITEHFDAFAAGFDAQLVGALGYDIPEKIAASVRAVGPAGSLYDTIDAGCGTGLCGPWLRSCARTLTGVDLSPKMLERAARRGLYDNLVCEDLTEFLARSPGRFDLLVAADVMIYFGDLAPPFQAAARAIRPGGLFAFSTEQLPGGTFQILLTGRFSHSAAYVRSLADAAFVEIACSETTIRLEATERVAGQVFVFRRR